MLNRAIKHAHAIVLGILLFPLALQAQFVDDAVRLSLEQTYPSARAGAIGLAYGGISDDFAAMAANPAGLILIPVEEFSIGMQMHQAENTGSFLDNAFTIDDNATALNHVAYAGRFNSGDVAGAIGIMYNYDTDFTQSYELSGFNTVNSLIGDWTSQGTPNGDPEDNVAYRLFLADTVDGQLITPISGQLLQESGIRESGGIHSLTGSAAFELENDLAIGFGIGVRWGSYEYEREYVELDRDNVYDQLDTVAFNNVDFDRLAVTERVEQDLSGVRFNFGLQKRFENFMRFGVSVSSPTFFSVEEDFSRNASVRFDNGDIYTDETDGFNDYQVSTAWTFGSGVSINIAQLTLSAAAEYRTMNEIGFHDGIDEVQALNRSVERVVDNQFNWGFGAEYDIPGLPLVLRSGYSYFDSPYADESFDSAREVLSFGAGLYLADNARLETMVRSHSGDFLRTNYNNASAALVNNKSLEVAVQFHIRFGR